MNADAASLDRLADIVTPPPAPWWPPAPGWFLVVGVIAAAIIAAAWRAWRTWKRNAYRRAALAEIDRIAAAASKNSAAWAELPEIVKRTALAAWPRADVASLAEDEWLAFLDRSSQTTAFTNGPGRELIDLAYDPKTPSRLNNQQSAELLAAVRNWIQRHSVSCTETKPC